ncbi:hypothetical protein [Alkaliphilus serpentinus]|nr:hypothetical protein [Alkaliphilus serpentinus]
MIGRKALVSGSYKWKVYSHRKAITLPDSFEYIVKAFVAILDLSEEQNKT